PTVSQYGRAPLGIFPPPSQGVKRRSNQETLRRCYSDGVDGLAAFAFPRRVAQGQIAVVPRIGEHVDRFVQYRHHYDRHHHCRIRRRHEQKTTWARRRRQNSDKRRRVSSYSRHRSAETRLRRIPMWTPPEAVIRIAAPCAEPVGPPAQPADVPEPAASAHARRFDAQHRRRRALLPIAPFQHRRQIRRQQGRLFAVAQAEKPRERHLPGDEPTSCLDNYRTGPHGYCVVYSTSDRSSFKTAEELLQVWIHHTLPGQSIF
ncbi:unnamed protein product, partial [Nesidiocoris tenuis]